MKLRKKIEKQEFVVFIAVQCPIDDSFSVIIYLSKVTEKLSKKKKNNTNLKSSTERKSILSFLAFFRFKSSNVESLGRSKTLGQFLCYV